nr:hypothetical protein [Massilia sp.]
MILRTARRAVLPRLLLPLLLSPLLAPVPGFAAPTIAGQVEETARAELEKQAEAIGLVDARFALTVVPPRAAPACSGPV